MVLPVAMDIKPSNPSNLTEPTEPIDPIININIDIDIEPYTPNDT